MASVRARPTRSGWEVAVNKYIHPLARIALPTIAIGVAVAAGLWLREKEERELTIGQLVERMKDDDDDIRYRARFELMTRGDVAIPRVLVLLEAEHRNAR